MLITSLLIAASAALSAPEAVAPAPLVVMSYNVRFGTAQDGPNAWEHRRELLVETVRRHAPAILGTQECLDFQATYLTEQLPGFGWIGLGREEDGGGEMTAVLYEKARLLPVESGHFWLSETPEIPGSKSWDSSLPRIATWIRFYDRVARRHFYYYNTHLDHRGEQARLESARMLARHIASRRAGAPVLITGDFNAAGGESAPWKALVDEGLVDLWDAATERRGLANTWNGFELPAPEKGRRIDWIFATPGVEAMVCTIDAWDKEGRYPSDHMPVIAQIRLPT